MWKYVSRRVRDTFEKSISHFDKRSTTGVANTNNISEDQNTRSFPPCRWFSSRKCWNTCHSDNGTNGKRWNFEHLNYSWISAITWSSALVIGWYTSQFIHLKHKYHPHINKRKCQPMGSLLCTLQPYVSCVNKKSAFSNSVSKLEKVIATFTPTVHLISNEQNRLTKEETSTVASTSSTSPDPSENDLGNVLNSIENKLGLAAIENGQHQDGLNLLRSAANRNHAPAMYNLGLCYEIGLGVPVNEKMAMDLYRAAATLHHPGALYNLGIYYGQGRGGLMRNVDTATRLLRLAARLGQEDAIRALEALQVDSTESSSSDNVPSWNNQYSHYTQNDNIVPSQTTLFVENNLLHMHNCEATVF